MRYKSKNIGHNKNVVQCVYTSNKKMEWGAINGIALLSVTIVNCWERVYNIFKHVLLSKVSTTPHPLLPVPVNTELPIHAVRWTLDNNTFSLRNRKRYLYQKCIVSRWLHRDTLQEKNLQEKSLFFL